MSVAPCVYADDAYLIFSFPGVVVTLPEKWLVTVLAAQVGEYAVNLGASAYPVDAAVAPVFPEVAVSLPAIADGLVTALGASTLAAVAPAGANSLTIQALAPASLGLTVTGPAVDTIEATLVSGGDTNAATRAFWLERAKCGLPPCCVVTCPAAFQSMRLGPASLTKGKSEWSGTPADAFLDTTAPGSLYLYLRSKYVLPIMCS